MAKNKKQLLDELIEKTSKWNTITIHTLAGEDLDVSIKENFFKSEIEAVFEDIMEIVVCLYEAGVDAPPIGAIMTMALVQKFTDLDLLEPAMSPYQRFARYVEMAEKLGNIEVDANKNILDVITENFGQANVDRVNFEASKFAKTMEMIRNNLQGSLGED